MKIRPQRRTAQVIAILFGLLAVPPAMWMLGHRVYVRFDDLGIFDAAGWFGTFVNLNNLIYVLPAALMVWWAVKAHAWALAAARRFVLELRARRLRPVDKPTGRG